MDSNLTTDESLVGDVLDCIKNILTGGEGRLAERWEEFKQSIQIKAIDRSVALKYEEKKEKEPRLVLEKLTKLECEEPKAFKSDIRNIKQKLELHDEERYRGAIVRARAESFVVED